MSFQHFDTLCAVWYGSVLSVTSRVALTLCRINYWSISYTAPQLVPIILAVSYSADVCSECVAAAGTNCRTQIADELLLLFPFQPLAATNCYIETTIGPSVNMIEISCWQWRRFCLNVSVLHWILIDTSIFLYNNWFRLLWIPLRFVEKYGECIFVIIELDSAGFLFENHVCWCISH